MSVSSSTQLTFNFSCNCMWCRLWSPWRGTLNANAFVFCFSIVIFFLYFVLLVVSTSYYSCWHTFLSCCPLNFWVSIRAIFQRSCPVIDRLFCGWFVQLVRYINSSFIHAVIINTNVRDLCAHDIDDRTKCHIGSTLFGVINIRYNFTASTSTWPA